MSDNTVMRQLLQRCTLRNLWLVLCVIGGVCGITSCMPDGQRLHSYRPVPTQGWASGDTLTFHVNLEDSLATYQLTIGVRHHDKYPYRNVALAVELRGEQPLLNDTMVCFLNDENGHWMGEGYGGLYLYVLPSRRFTIPRSGTYYITVSHAMTDSLLHGLSDVGVRIESIP